MCRTCAFWLMIFKARHWLQTELYTLECHCYNLYYVYALDEADAKKQTNNVIAIISINLTLCTCIHMYILLELWEYFVVLLMLILLQQKNNYTFHLLDLNCSTAFNYGDLSYWKIFLFLNMFNVESLNTFLMITNCHTKSDFNSYYSCNRWIEWFKRFCQISERNHGSPWYQKLHPICWKSYQISTSILTSSLLFQQNCKALEPSTWNRHISFY